MLPITILIGVTMWSSRIDAYRIGKFNQTTDNRSGGFPKFSQSFSSSANKFIHEFYKFSNNNLERNRPIYNRNTCGIRTINYSPKRTGRIIGGMYLLFYPFGDSLAATGFNWPPLALIGQRPLYYISYKIAVIFI